MTVRTQPGSNRRSPWLAVAIAAGLVLLGLTFHNARYGAVSPRIRNPSETGDPHPLSNPLFGYGHWIVTIEVFSYLALVSTLAWLDAPMNWATFAAYNPDLWHWPEDWPIVSLSPTIEPLFIAAIAMFVVPPFFPAIWVLRRLQAHRPRDSFVSRHPLISLSGLVFVFGFAYDFAMEQLCVRIGLYTFTQVIPFGSVFTGTRWQFPLLWQSSLISILLIPAAALIYRDDTGRAVAERLALRAKIMPSRPVLATFIVMVVGVNVAFMTYESSTRPSRGGRARQPRSYVHGRGRAPKSMTHRASTRGTAHRGPTRKESGRPGRASSPADAHRWRLHRLTVDALPVCRKDVRDHADDALRHEGS